MNVHIDLSHVIVDGMVTYPGLPVPIVADHLSREAAEEIYGPGITFQIGVVTICTNTGTYLDVPFHRFADGHDLTALDLARVAGVDAVRIDCRGQRIIDLTDVDASSLTGRAVLIWTDHSTHWGTPNYFESHPALSATAAEKLVAAGVACVGIDSLNIDVTEGTGERPVHTTLLGDQIPIIEHLTNLATVTDEGFTFTAVPPKIEGAGTFTVRAFATF
ncbi:MAG: cyclase family protein [Acidimicrobiales bacterium]|nr:cyclase family protein [Acidimicrobiales bacterium]